MVAASLLLEAGNKNHPRLYWLRRVTSFVLEQGYTGFLPVVVPVGNNRVGCIDVERGGTAHTRKTNLLNFIIMLNGLYYLNNTGSRWIVLENGKRQRISLRTKSGKIVNRSVNYYESFGNFAVANISYKGKRINVFADSVLED